MSIYALAHIIHLFCAIMFIGGVFFEMLVLRAIHDGSLSREIRKPVETVIARRAVRVMPFVVLLLFASGITMAYYYRTVLSYPWHTPFSVQLSLKIVLALSVLVHFLIAVTKIWRGTLTAAWSRYIHRAVLVHMVVIVLLAKLMFYSAT